MYRLPNLLIRTYSAVAAFYCALALCCVVSISQAQPTDTSMTLQDLKGEHIGLPALPQDLPSDRYIHATPNDLQEYINDKIVLIDIWDYTCVNCIRTLPYIRSWHEKYKDLGLAIIGVHTPEFEFAKLRSNVDSAVNQYGLTHPIILDNNFAIWDAMANKYWPAKYLYDTRRKLRTQHFGEGQYHEFERFIQKLLLERDPNVKLPALTPIQSETDAPGAVCYRTSPEMYLGFERSRFGNEDEVEPNITKVYMHTGDIERDKVTLVGTWQIKRQHARPGGGDTASILLSYQAKEVNMVVKPEGKGAIKVLVEQDHGPLPLSDRGTDIIEENGKTYLVVDRPRMYNVVNNKTFSRYMLKLSSNDPNLAAYSFTFTTACMTPESEDQD